MVEGRERERERFGSLEQARKDEVLAVEWWFCGTRFEGWALVLLLAGGQK
jgi:hypothetical protein